MVYDIDDFIKGRGKVSVIHNLNAFSKITLFVILSSVFFLNEMNKVIIIGLFIILLLLLSYSNFTRSPTKIFFVLLVFISSLMYQWRTGYSDIEILVVNSLRIPLVMVVGYVAGGSFSDREIRFLCKGRLSPLLIGALVCFQRIEEIYQNIGHAQWVRGIRTSWSSEKTKQRFLSLGMTLLINLARLAEIAELQFTLRKYKSDDYRTYLKGYALEPIDYLANILAMALIVIILI